MIYTWKYSSELGQITLAGSERVLTGLWFEGQKHFAPGIGPETVTALTPVFRQTVEWLDCYFAGGIPDFVPALATEGTAFQEVVWGILRTVPYGQTMTYGQLAERASALAAGGQFDTPGARPSARAVGQAVGRNPISLIIPCHRIVAAGGALGGYAAGQWRKERLLKLEARRLPG